MTTDGGRGLGFLPTGIARLAAELTLPVPPELAARVRDVALSPPEGPEAQMELIATVAELRALAEAATRSGGDGDRALWRAAGSLGLLLDDDAEAIATLERMAELLAAEPLDGAAPDPEDRAVAAWCLATVAVAHRSRGRTVDATVAVRRTRERVDADLAAGTIPPEDAVRIATVLAFGAADPARSRGAIRRLERDAVRLLGPGAPAVVEARDLHGELMVAAGEHRAAVRHYRALADDLSATRGDDDRLTVMARSSLLFARARAGEDPRTVAREYRALVEAAEAAAARAEAGGGSGSGPDGSDLRALGLNLIQMLVDVGEVAAARARIDAAVDEVRAELAGDPDATSDGLMRGVGSQGMRAVDRLIMLLVLRYESLDGDVERGDRDAIRSAASVALELHELCERHGDAPMLSRNTALRLALMTLGRAGRQEESATVLRRALDGRAERYGDGSEQHVAAMAIAAYLAGLGGGGEDRSSHAATMALSLLDAGGDPEAERHRRVLELLRDRKPVRLVDHGL